MSEFPEKLDFLIKNMCLFIKCNDSPAAQLDIMDSNDFINLPLLSRWTSEEEEAPVLGDLELSGTGVEWIVVLAALPACFL